MNRFVCLVFLLVLVCAIVIVESGKIKERKEKDCSNVKKGKPLCDQNGNIYSNLCEFKKSQKMLKKKNVVLEKTKCPKASTVRPRIPKTSKKVKKLNEKRKAKKEKKAMKALKKMEKCMKPCSTGKNVSVCASNVTYPDYCQFKRARCKARLSGVKLVYFYKGECGNPKPCETYNEKMRKGVCNSDGSQSIRGFPVCATDGNSYHYPCEFLRAKCAYMKNNPGKELEVKQKKQRC